MTKETAVENNSKMDKLIASIVGNIVEKKGEGSATTLGDIGLRPLVNGWLSTGSMSLDHAISPSGKGVPVGRLTEIFGDEASSKTTVSWHILADTQKKGGVAVLIEPESAAFDMVRAKKIGLDPEALVYLSPGTIEDVFDAIDIIIDTALADDPKRIVTIVWDSVAATSTRKEIEGEYGDAVMGEHARLISQAMRKVMSKMKESNGITLIFINQTRDKIGGYGGQATFGGKAIKFYASVRIKLRPSGVIRGHEEKAVGMHFEAEVIKNKVAPPFRKASYRMMFDEASGGSIDYTDSVLTVAIEKKVVVQSGAWLDYNGKKFYRKDWDTVLSENPDILTKL